LAQQVLIQSLEEPQLLQALLEEKKGIKTMRRDDGKWVAYKTETRFNNSDETEVDAVIGLAKKLKLKLWSEDP
jgi:hypothetical protein